VVLVAGLFHCLICGSPKIPSAAATVVKVCSDKITPDRETLRPNEGDSIQIENAIAFGFGREGTFPSFKDEVVCVVPLEQYETFWLLSV
jgi:hypothetical protein